MLFEFNFIFNLATKAFFNIPHHSGLSCAYLLTEQIPEAHETSTLAITPNQHRTALPCTGQDPSEHPQSAAGLAWRSQVQDTARTMKAAIWLSLPAEPSATATEHEDLPELGRRSLVRRKTHSFTIHHFLSIWGHTALFPLLLLPPLNQLMRCHHTALTRHTCLTTGTLKLLKYTLKLQHVKSLHLQPLPLTLQLPHCLMQRPRQVQGYHRRIQLPTAEKPPPVRLG